MILTSLMLLGASENQRHFHGGRLLRYEIGPPQLLLSASDEKRLRTGRSVLQTVVAEDGLSRRMIVVQDINAPTHIVLGRIMDLKKYPEMVSGVNSLEIYDQSEKDGQQIVKSTYEISALHMKFKYYVTHIYDPGQKCMVFSLDYDRRSDLDDSVGYWFVDAKGRSASRVYYSCECKLRGWVPGPVYGLLTTEAAKKATTWVERESLKEWRASRSGPFSGEAIMQLMDNVRETLEKAAQEWSPPNLKEALPKLPTLSLPPLPIKRRAADWIANRQEAAGRAAAAVVQSRKAYACSTSIY